MIYSKIFCILFSRNWPCFLVLQPLNIQARLKIATAPSEQDYVRPVFDAKIDLEEISLNINRNQVRKKD